MSALVLKLERDDEVFPWCITIQFLIQESLLGRSRYFHLTLSTMSGRLSPKSILWVVFLVLITMLLFLSTVDFRAVFPTRLINIRDAFGSTSGNSVFIGGSPYLKSRDSCENPLKVYMYDIPRKFNLGMLKPRSGKQNLPWGKKRIPPWPERSGLKKQHSVEYWMMVYLLDEKGDKGKDRAAVRVTDPARADVFFVPFFSSLSFNVHGQNMTDPETEKDRLLQVEVVRFLKQSSSWEQSKGRDHVLVVHHPNAFRFLRDELNTSILVVADFGRYPKNVSSLSKDVVAPYTHVVDTFENDDITDPFESRTILLFFRGRTMRKDDGIVRRKLAKILQNQSRVHFEDSLATIEGLDLTTKGMRVSRFCLHPAGDTPSSCRLFDAIVSHCVPVIVSDKIELPFEDELEYRDFSLFFSMKEALTPGYMLNYLEYFPKERWLRMWNMLKIVSHHFEFQHPARKDDAVNMIWKQIHKKIPAVKLAIRRSKRLKIPDWWK